MKNIIAFSGSNSSNSINQQLAKYAAGMVEGGNLIALTSYDVPMYGIDLELNSGIPDGVKNLMADIQAADAVIISTPEHNGMMPAFFKSILDWLSRTGVKYLEGTNVLLMSASPGRGGAKGGAASVAKIIGYAGANIVSEFNFPSFGENFDTDTGRVVNEELNNALKEGLAKL